MTIDKNVINEAIKSLKSLQEYGDPESAHNGADEVLCKVLISLGLQEVVDEWDLVDKWYA